MIDPLSVCIGLVFGGLIGVMVTCLCVVAKDNRRQEETP